MAKIILCRGIQGSGKTTWARDWVKQFPVNRIRINNDDIRNMLGPYWIPEREDLVSNIKRDIALRAITMGYDIVVDNMNLNPREVKFWENIVNYHNVSLNSKESIRPDWIQHEYEIEFKDFFNTSLQECIDRDSKRLNPIGEKVIRDTYEKYKNIIEKK